MAALATFLVAAFAAVLLSLQPPLHPTAVGNRLPGGGLLLFEFFSVKFICGRADIPFSGAIPCSFSGARIRAQMPSGLGQLVMATLGLSAVVLPAASTSMHAMRLDARVGFAIFLPRVLTFFPLDIPCHP